MIICAKILHFRDSWNKIRISFNSKLLSMCAYVLMCTHIKKMLLSNFATPLPPDLHPRPATDFAMAFGHRYASSIKGHKERSYFIEAHVAFAS